MFLLKDLLVGLILKCEKGGSQIINLLLDCITSISFHNIDGTTRIVIKEKAQEILGNNYVYLVCS